jgi:hypothetical protein
MATANLFAAALELTQAFVSASRSKVHGKHSDNAVHGLV